MIFSIDFDGTLCENKYPYIGEPKTNIIEKCKELKKSGHKIILNTCRTGSKLKDALKWCSKQGLKFDKVNENLPERIKDYDNDSRKIGADFYIDDKNISLEDFLKLGLIPHSSICPICGGEMDETELGTQCCWECTQLLKRL